MIAAAEIHVCQFGGPTGFLYEMPAIHAWAPLVFICIFVVSFFKWRSGRRKDLPGNLRAVWILRWPTLNLGLGVLGLTLGLSITVSDVWYWFYSTALHASGRTGAGIDSIDPSYLGHCMYGFYGGLCLLTAGFVQYGLFCWLAKKSQDTKITSPKPK